MNINRITAINYNTYPANTRKETETTGTVGLQPKQIKEYHPHSYMDFNINFGARLFRSPANFYAQPFNQKGMPVTMKNYLNDDYEDRQNIPPAQMMKIVFSDINEAQSLEQVKEMYPDEPLFQNLHDIDYSKYRTGTLGDIFALKDNQHTLFKDGSDDLGLYLLKKMYVECKSLKEIIPDFRKDISDYYKDIADLDHITAKNFGIRYPMNGFWRSLSATREEFPYEYKPRKGVASRLNGGGERTLNDIVEKRKRFPEKPKYDVTDNDIRKMADTILESGGNIGEIDKGLKKKGIRGKDDGKRTFICQYFGPIMSITLDRIHASEEMRDFFNDYDSSVSKSQKRKMQAYWNEHPDMKELQSLIMSDTIKLFFEVYGADGENDYFKELIEYANSIKPEREAQKKKHQELQEEYERELAIYEDPKEEIILEPERELTSEELNKQEMDEYRRKYNLKDYILTAPDGRTLKLALNLPKATDTYIHSILDNALPNSYINKYVKHMLKSKYATDEYKLAIIIKSSPEMQTEPKINDYLLDDEKIFETSRKINNEFIDKYPKESRAAIEAIISSLTKLYENDEEKLSMMYGISPLNISAIMNVGKGDHPQVFKDTFEKVLTESLDENYVKYIKPLDKKEINQITNEITKRLKEYNPEKSKVEEFNNDSLFCMTLGIVAISPNKEATRLLKNNISSYLQTYGGSMRSMIDPDIPEEIKKIKMGKFITSMMLSDQQKSHELIKSDSKALWFAYINLAVLKDK